MLADIEVTEPFAVNGVIVKRVTVSPIGFSDMIACRNRANRYGANVADDVGLRRACLAKQVAAYNKDGTAVPLDDVAFGQMPVRLYRQITKAINSQAEPGGEIIRAGNGIEDAVLYKLGTPLTFKGGEGEGVIKELEFLARTAGEIERVMVANSPFDQVLALFQDCAAPLGSDVTLQRLPSWMIDQISLTDGLTIMGEVLPSFLE